MDVGLAMNYESVVFEMAKSVGFGAIALFFIKRFISKTDDSLKELKQDAKDYRREFNYMYTKLNERINDHIKAMTDNRQDNSTTILGLRKLILEQIYNIKEEIDSLKRKIDENSIAHATLSEFINKDMPSLKENFGRIIVLNGKLSKLEKEISKNREAIGVHKDVLLKSKDVLTAHRKELDSLKKK